MQTGKNEKKDKTAVSQIATASIIAFIIVALYAFVNHWYLTPRIAYVDTGKLMIGFAETNKVDREINAENDRWQAQYKLLQDSLEAAVKVMSKDYNSATTAKKKEMQDMLSARNQEINNFKQANIRKMDEMRQNKMKSNIEKINVYMAEYGKKHHYTIIFGTTAGGNIVYADNRAIDITEDIVKGLNERYR